MRIWTLFAESETRDVVAQDEIESVTSDDVASSLTTSFNDFVDALVDALPRLASAVVVVVLGYLLSKVVRAVVMKVIGTKRGESYSRVMSKLAGWIVLFAAVMGAAAVAFPSVKPVDLLAGLGFFSIAIGFAFQDILENTLSGLLLLVREPFTSGDQIEVDGNEGTVQAITIRETRMKTYDGQMLIIPNRDVYKTAIKVKTEKEHRRMNFALGVSYEDDLKSVQDLIVSTLATVEEVESDPVPEALVSGMGVSTIDFDVRFWVDSIQHEAKVATSAAIIAVKRALDDAGVEFPCDIVALQATDSFRAAMYDRPVTPSGSKRPESNGSSSEGEA